MKATDRTIMIGLLMLGLVAGFWFLVLAPKRERASELQTQIEEVRASVEQQEQLATFAEQAKDEYDDNYRQLIVLGKAVPEDDDTATLFEQLNALSAKAGVQFRDIELNTTAQSAAPPAPAPAPAPTDSSLPTEPSTSTPAATPAAEPAPVTDPAAIAAATEAAAAALPIGATVGAAGLPVMPYKVVFRGDFFDVAGILAGVDDLVHADDEGVRVGGRLLTVDGFNVEQDPGSGFPSLKASVVLTSYVVPAAQGLLGGATPTAPAAGVPALASASPLPATTTPTTTTAPTP